MAMAMGRDGFRIVCAIVSKHISGELSCMCEYVCICARVKGIFGVRASLGGRRLLYLFMLAACDSWREG